MSAATVSPHRERAGRILEAVAPLLSSDDREGLAAKLSLAEGFGVGPMDAALQWLDDVASTERNFTPRTCGEDDAFLEGLNVWIDGVERLIRGASR